MRVGGPHFRISDGLGQLNKVLSPRAFILYTGLAVVIGLLVHSGMTVGHDAGADWMFLKSAWGGHNPYRPLGELYRYAGFLRFDTGVPSRTPATVLIEAPLLFVPAELVGETVIMISAVCLVLVLAAAALLSGRRLRWWAVVAVVLSPPVIFSLRYANPVFIYTLLIMWTLLLSRHQDGWTSGIPLGVAIALRLWPGLLAIGLFLARRRKAAVASMTVGLGLNVAGLALSGVSVSNAVSGLAEANRVWYFDFGVSRWIHSSFSEVIAVAVAVAFVIAARGFRRDVVSVAILSSVLASPISWSTYYLVAAPIVARQWARPLTVVGVLAVVAGRISFAILVPLGGVMLLIDALMVPRDRPLILGAPV